MVAKIQDPMKRKIASLAKRTRGGRARHEIYDVPNGPSRSAYTHFESLNSWPRSATLNRIENALGWKEGIVNAILDAEYEPKIITAAILKGTSPLPSVAGDDEQNTEAAQSAPNAPAVDEPTTEQVSAQETPEQLPELEPAVAEPVAPPREVPAPVPASTSEAREVPAVVMHTSFNPHLAAFSDYELLRESALRAAAKEIDLEL